MWHSDVYTPEAEGVLALLKPNIRYRPPRYAVQQQNWCNLLARTDLFSWPVDLRKRARSQRVAEGEI